MKLSEKDIINIRIKYQNAIASRQELCKEYNVSLCTINKVLGRKGIYKNVI